MRAAASSGVRLAELLAFDEAEREVAYFSGLLAWVGCHTDAYEQAKWFGDDIALKRDGYHYDMGRPVDLLAFAWHTVGRGRPPLERFKTWLELPLAVRRSAMVDLRNHWLAADELASRLGLSEPVRRSLKESFASAQEVVQEAWLAMIQGLDKFEGRSSLRTWMLAILGNIGRSRGVRESRTVPLSSLGPDEGDGPAVDPDRFRGPDDKWPRNWTPLGKPQPWPRSPEEETMAAESRTQLENGLAELPERQRTVVTLRDVHGLSSEEVSSLLGLSAGNQRVLLHRGRSRLRGLLEWHFATGEPVMRT